MHQVRAKSYLRRTASEPFCRRRPSNVITAAGVGVLHGSGNGREMHRTLIMSDSMISEGEDVEDPLALLTRMDNVNAIQSMLLTKLNLLLLFSPLGIMAGVYGWGDIWVFSFNFLSLIPLAALLGNATEELGLHMGDLIGGLINATFGNAIEMIFTVQSLKRGLLTVVQCTLLGSILSNLLLVLGMSFYAGGLHHHIQKFNAQGATCSTSLLLLASMSIITPTVAAVNQKNDSDDIVMISRCTACLIAGTYCLFLFFQLHTHLQLFKDADRDGEMSGEDMEWPSMSLYPALAFTFFITLFISYQSDFLISAIDGLVYDWGIPEGFIGVILLPIVGNASEHLTAVTVAIKDKVDLTMGVAVGSSTQIAMFMVPFAVLVGWGMDKPMTLAFNHVSATVLFLAILIVIGVVQDGESNWLEGVMLMVAYLIVAVVFWFDKSMSSDFSQGRKGGS